MNDAAAQPSESIELIYEFQREMSRLTDPAELVKSFVVALSRVLPMSRIMYVLPWPPAVRRFSWIPGPDIAPGSLGYRVLLNVDLSRRDWQEGTDFRSLFTPRTDFVADAKGGLLGEIITQEQSVQRDDLRLAASEPVLGSGGAAHRSMAAVPIFWQGKTQAWIVVFADVAGAFSKSDVGLLLSTGNMLARSAVHLDTLEEARRANARLNATFDEIGRVQRLLLPGVLPSDPRLRFAMSYQPCEAAGGDLYDVYAPDADKLELVIADVSGHGPVASVAMAMLRTAMHSWRRGGRAINTVIPELNTLMQSSLDEGMFITACFLSLDRRTGVLEYVNCGHNPPIVRRRSGEVASLDGEGGPPLGVCEELCPPVASFRLEPGDLMVLYTDGIPEAFSPQNELFGMQRFVQSISEGGGDPELTRRVVLSAVESHAAGRPRADDQTLVAIGFGLDGGK
ncbi:MAG: GAF domain-containing SpoIIE family protein phosphatase [Phycisphaerales bacterium]